MKVHTTYAFTVDKELVAAARPPGVVLERKRYLPYIDSEDRLPEETLSC